MRTGDAAGAADTSAAAVSRLADDLQDVRWPADQGCRMREDAALTLRDLLAERDAARAEAARLREAVTLGADALDALLDGGAVLSAESASITRDFVWRMRAALNQGDDR